MSTPGFWKLESGKALRVKQKVSNVMTALYSMNTTIQRDSSNAINIAPAISCPK